MGHLTPGPFLCSVFIGFYQCLLWKTKFIFHQSHITMRTTTILHLILGCLLQITWGSAADSCSQVKVLRINVNQINGLWNLRAIASRPTLPALTVLNKAHYSYTKISLSEKEGRIAEFFNPMEGICDDPTIFERVEDEKEKLTYRKVDKEAPGSFTFLRLHPDVLIVNRESNEKEKTSALYERSSSHPESKLEDFKEWAKCKGFTIIKEFENTVDYAQKCYGILEDKAPLHLKKDEDTFTSWHLVSKSSTSMDQHYNVRILYTARIEISKEEQTLKEIISAPIDKVIFEMKLEKPSEDGNVALLMETEDGLLLLGVRTKTGRTLYLASKTPTVKQSVIDKFEAQALCFETKFNYFIPGSIRENDGEEVCARELKQWVPKTFPQSVGKWVLMASAYKNLRTVLIEQQIYKETEYTLLNGKINQVITLKTFSDGDSTTTRTRTQEIDVEMGETTDDIIFIVSRQNETTIHSVNPNCNVFSSQERRLLTCRKDHVPPVSDIIQFVKYATCQDLNKILIHQPLSTSCSDVPTEIPILDVEKIAGTWKLIAVSSNLEDGDVKFPNVFIFIVKNGEVTITDGKWSGATKKIGENRLQYGSDDGPAMEMRFYEPLEDHLLIWTGNGEKKFLNLFSKSSHAKPEELIRFKHFAACLSTRVVFLRD